MKDGAARATRTLGPLGRAPRAGSRRYVEVQKGKGELRREKVSSGLRKFTEGAVEAQEDLREERRLPARNACFVVGQGKGEGVDKERGGVESRAAQVHGRSVVAQVVPAQSGFPAHNNQSRKGGPVKEAGATGRAPRAGSRRYVEVQKGKVN